MSFQPYLKDLCIIQNRVVNTTDKVDIEDFVAQATPTKCRAMIYTTKRRSSPDTAEKVQYGTFIFMTFILPKTAVVAIHDRIMYPPVNGQVFDVAAVNTPGTARKDHHIVARCDARA